MHRIIPLLLSLILVACGQEVAHLKPSTGPVVILGDSLAVGYGVERQGFVEVLSQRLGVEIINRGKNGDTTATGLARLEEDVLTLKPGLVIVELGGNDALRRVEPQDTFKNLDEIVAQIQAEGVPVLLLGIRGGVFSDRYGEFYQELAERRQTAYVGDLMKGVMTSPELKYDQIHPNAAGHQLLADRVEPTLRELLTEMKSKNE